MTYIPDQTDYRILFELDKNARIPETKLAKIVGKSKESVRYRIKRLKEEYILGFSIWLNPSCTGFLSGKMYLNLANIPEKKKELIDFLKKDKRLFWLGIAEGAWNLGLTYFIKNQEEFFNIKKEISSRFKELIIEIKTANIVDILYHEKTFLHYEKTNFKSFINHKTTNIDQIEIKILKDLLKDSKKNISDLAYENKTTVDIIRNRIKKMEKEKVIIKYYALINYQKLGYDFYKSFLYLKNLEEKELEKLISYCEKSKNIIHIVKQISPWDIELEIMCKGFAEYNQIISNLTEEFADSIQRIETAIMLEDHIFPSKTLIFE